MSNYNRLPIPVELLSSHELYDSVRKFVESRIQFNDSRWRIILRNPRLYSRSVDSDSLSFHPLVDQEMQVIVAQLLREVMPSTTEQTGIDMPMKELLKLNIKDGIKSSKSSLENISLSTQIELSLLWRTLSVMNTFDDPDTILLFYHDFLRVLRRLPRFALSTLWSQVPDLKGQGDRFIGMALATIPDDESKHTEQNKNRSRAFAAELRFLSSDSLRVHTHHDPLGIVQKMFDMVESNIRSLHVHCNQGGVVVQEYAVLFEMLLALAVKSARLSLIMRTACLLLSDPSRNGVVPLVLPVSVDELLNELATYIDQQTNAQSTPITSGSIGRYCGMTKSLLTKEAMDYSKMAVQMKQFRGGTALSFGKADHGKLGHGDSQLHRLVPTLIDSLKDEKIVKVASMSAYSMAINDLGTVYIWGTGGAAGSAHGARGDVYPQILDTLPMKAKVVDLSCGLGHSLFLLDSGLVYSWGNGGNGRLGLGDTTDRSEACLVLALSKVNVAAVQCGASHSMARTAQGNVYCWGKNTQGQCGLNHADDVLRPTLLKTLIHEVVTQLDAGWEHSVALTDEGRIYAWGCGYKDTRRGVIPPVLGLGHNECRMSPERIASLDGVFITKVICGWDHCLALDKSGKLLSWGSGQNGKLGHGSEENYSIPCYVSSLENVKIVFVAAGCEHSAAVSDNGTLYTWGHGEGGRLGHGDNVQCSIPTPVLPFGIMNLRPFKVHCGDKFTVAIARPYDSVAGGDPLAVGSDRGRIINRSLFLDPLLSIEAETDHPTASSVGIDTNKSPTEELRSYENSRSLDGAAYKLLQMAAQMADIESGKQRKGKKSSLATVVDGQTVSLTSSNDKEGNSQPTELVHIDKPYAVECTPQTFSALSTILEIFVDNYIKSGNESLHLESFSPVNWCLRILETNLRGLNSRFNVGEKFGTSKNDPNEGVDDDDENDEEEDEMEDGDDGSDQQLGRNAFKSISRNRRNVIDKTKQKYHRSSPVGLDLSGAVELGDSSSSESEDYFGIGESDDEFDDDDFIRAQQADTSAVASPLYPSKLGNLSSNLTASSTIEPSDGGYFHEGAVDLSAGPHSGQYTTAAVSASNNDDGSTGGRVSPAPSYESCDHSQGIAGNEELNHIKDHLSDAGSELGFVDRNTGGAGGAASVAIGGDAFAPLSGLGGEEDAMDMELQAAILTSIHMSDEHAQTDHFGTQPSRTYSTATSNSKVLSAKNSFNAKASTTNENVNAEHIQHGQSNDLFRRYRQGQRDPNSKFLQLRPMLELLAMQCYTHLSLPPVGSPITAFKMKMLGNLWLRSQCVITEGYPTLYGSHDEQVGLLKSIVLSPMSFVHIAPGVIFGFLNSENMGEVIQAMFTACDSEADDDFGTVPPHEPNASPLTVPNVMTLLEGIKLEFLATNPYVAVKSSDNVSIAGVMASSKRLVALSFFKLSAAILSAQLTAAEDLQDSDREQSPQPLNLLCLSDGEWHPDMIALLTEVITCLVMDISHLSEAMKHYDLQEIRLSFREHSFSAQMLPALPLLFPSSGSSFMNIRWIIPQLTRLLDSFQSCCVAAGSLDLAKSAVVSTVIADLCLPDYFKWVFQYIASAVNFVAHNNSFQSMASNIRESFRPCSVLFARESDHTDFLINARADQDPATREVVKWATLWKDLTMGAKDVALNQEKVNRDASFQRSLQLIDQFLRGLVFPSQVMTHMMALMTSNPSSTISQDSNYATALSTNILEMLNKLPNSDLIAPAVGEYSNSQQSEVEMLNVLRLALLASCMKANKLIGIISQVSSSLEGGNMQDIEAILKPTETRALLLQSWFNSLAITLVISQTSDSLSMINRRKFRLFEMTEKCWTLFDSSLSSWPAIVTSSMIEDSVLVDLSQLGSRGGALVIAGFFVDAVAKLSTYFRTRSVACTLAVPSYHQYCDLLLGSSQTPSFDQSGIDLATISHCLVLGEVAVVLTHDVSVEMLEFCSSWDHISYRNKLCAVTLINKTLSKISGSPQSVQYFIDNLTLFEWYTRIQMPSTQSQSIGQLNRTVAFHDEIDSSAMQLHDPNSLPPNYVLSQLFRSSGMFYSAGSNASTAGTPIIRPSEPEAATIKPPASAEVKEGVLDKMLGLRLRQEPSEESFLFDSQSLEECRKVLTLLRCLRMEMLLLESHSESALTSTCCVDVMKAVIHLSLSVDRATVMQSYVTKQEHFLVLSDVIRTSMDILMWPSRLDYCSQQWYWQQYSPGQQWLVSQYLTLFTQLLSNLQSRIESAHAEYHTFTKSLFRFKGHYLMSNSKSVQHSSPNIVPSVFSAHGDYTLGFWIKVPPISSIPPATVGQESTPNKQYIHLISRVPETGEYSIVSLFNRIFPCACNPSVFLVVDPSGHSSLEVVVSVLAGHQQRTASGSSSTYFKSTERIHVNTKPLECDRWTRVEIKLEAIPMGASDTASVKSVKESWRLSVHVDGALDSEERVESSRQQLYQNVVIGTLPGHFGAISDTIIFSDLYWIPSSISVPLLEENSHHSVPPTVISTHICQLQELHVEVMRNCHVLASAELYRLSSNTVGSQPLRQQSVSNSVLSAMTTLAQAALRAMLVGNVLMQECAFDFLRVCIKLLPAVEPLATSDKESNSSVASLTSSTPIAVVFTEATTPVLTSPGLPAGSAINAALVSKFYATMKLVVAKLRDLSSALMNIDDGYTINIADLIHKKWTSSKSPRQEHERGITLTPTGPSQNLPPTAATNANVDVFTDAYDCWLQRWYFWVMNVSRSLHCEDMTGALMIVSENTILRGFTALTADAFAHGDTFDSLMRRDHNDAVLDDADQSGVRSVGIDDASSTLFPALAAMASGGWPSYASFGNTVHVFTKGIKLFDGRFLQPGFDQVFFPTQGQVVHGHSSRPGLRLSNCVGMFSAAVDCTDDVYCPKQTFIPSNPNRLVAMSEMVLSRDFHKFGPLSKLTSGMLQQQILVSSALIAHLKNAVSMLNANQQHTSPNTQNLKHKKKVQVNKAITTAKSSSSSGLAHSVDVAADVSGGSGSMGGDILSTDSDSSVKILKCLMHLRALLVQISMAFSSTPGSTKDSLLASLKSLLLANKNLSNIAEIALLDPVDTVGNIFQSGILKGAQLDVLKNLLKECDVNFLERISLRLWRQLRFYNKKQIESLPHLSSESTQSETALQSTEALLQAINIHIIAGEVNIVDCKVRALYHFPSLRLADVGLQRMTGRWFYECTLLSDGLMQIGWANSNFRCDPVCGQGVGDHLHSWAFDGLRNKKWNVSCDAYGKRWHVGDVVGLLIDMDLLEMRFYLNGEDLGSAFTSFNTTAEIFPALSLNVRQCIRINFGQHKFLFPPDEIDGKPFRPLVQAISMRPPPSASTTAIAANMARMPNKRTSAGAGFSGGASTALATSSSGPSADVSRTGLAPAASNVSNSNGISDPTSSSALTSVPSISHQLVESASLAITRVLSMEIPITNHATVEASNLLGSNIADGVEATLAEEEPLDDTADADLILRATPSGMYSSNPLNVRAPANVSANVDERENEDSDGVGSEDDEDEDDEDDDDDDDDDPRGDGEAGDNRNQEDQLGWRSSGPSHRRYPNEEGTPSNGAGNNDNQDGSNNGHNNNRGRRGRYDDGFNGEDGSGEADMDADGYGDTEPNQEGSSHAADLRRQALIENLIGMGFPIDWAVRAAENCESTASESTAIAWIIERMELEQHKLEDIEGDSSRAGDEEDFDDGDEAGLDFLIQRNLANGEGPDDLVGHGGHDYSALHGLAGSPGNTLRDEIATIQRANGNLILGMGNKEGAKNKDGTRGSGVSATGASNATRSPDHAIHMLEKNKQYGLWNGDVSYTALLLGLHNNREKHIFDKQDVLGQISELDPQDMIPIISSCQFALCIYYARAIIAKLVDFSSEELIQPQPHSHDHSSAAITENPGDNTVNRKLFVDGADGVEDPMKQQLTQYNGGNNSSQVFAQAIFHGIIEGVSANAIPELLRVLCKQFMLSSYLADRIFPSICRCNSSSSSTSSSFNTDGDTISYDVLPPVDAFVGHHKLRLFQVLQHIETRQLADSLASFSVEEASVPGPRRILRIVEVLLRTTRRNYAHVSGVGERGRIAQAQQSSISSSLWDFEGQLLRNIGVNIDHASQPSVDYFTSMCRTALTSLIEVAVSTLERAGAPIYDAVDFIVSATSGGKDDSSVEDFLGNNKEGLDDQGNNQSHLKQPAAALWAYSVLKAILSSSSLFDVPMGSVKFPTSTSSDRGLAGKSSSPSRYTTGNSGGESLGIEMDYLPSLGYGSDPVVALFTAETVSRLLKVAISPNISLKFLIYDICSLILGHFVRLLKLGKSRNLGSQSPFQRSAPVPVDTTPTPDPYNPMADESSDDLLLQPLQQLAADYYVALAKERRLFHTFGTRFRAENLYRKLYSRFTQSLASFLMNIQLLRDTLVVSSSNHIHEYLTQDWDPMASTAAVVASNHTFTLPMASVSSNTSGSSQQQQLPPGDGVAVSATAAQGSDTKAPLLNVIQVSPASITVAWNLNEWRQASGILENLGAAGSTIDTATGTSASVLQHIWSLYIAAASSMGIDDPILILPDIDDVGSYRVDDLEPDTMYKIIVALNSSSSDVNITLDRLTLQPNDKSPNYSLYATTECEPVFVFDRAHMSPHLVIASNQLTLRNTASKKWSTARINVKMVSGLHKWEVHIDRCISKNIFIGICSAEAKFDNYCGCDRFGWAFLANRAIWHNKSKHKSYGELFRTGDTVAVTLDLDQGTLRFSLNGLDLGVAVEGVGPGPLYPAFSLYNEDDQISIVPPRPTVDAMTWRTSSPERVVDRIEAAFCLLSFIRQGYSANNHTSSHTGGYLSSILVNELSKRWRLTTHDIPLRCRLVNGDILCVVQCPQKCRKLSQNKFYPGDKAMLDESVVRLLGYANHKLWFQHVLSGEIVGLPQDSITQLFTKGDLRFLRREGLPLSIGSNSYAFKTINWRTQRAATAEDTRSAAASEAEAGEATASSNPGKYHSRPVADFSIPGTLFQSLLLQCGTWTEQEDTSLLAWLEVVASKRGVHPLEVPLAHLLSSRDSLDLIKALHPAPLSNGPTTLQLSAALAQTITLFDKHSDEDIALRLLLLTHVNDIIGPLLPLVAVHGGNLSEPSASSTSDATYTDLSLSSLIQRCRAIVLPSVKRDFLVKVTSMSHGHSHNQSQGQSQRQSNGASGANSIGGDERGMISPPITGYIATSPPPEAPVPSANQPATANANTPADDILAGLNAMILDMKLVNELTPGAIQPPLSMPSNLVNVGNSTGSSRNEILMSSSLNAFSPSAILQQHTQQQTTEKSTQDHPQQATQQEGLVNTCYVEDEFVIAQQIYDSVSTKGYSELASLRDPRWQLALGIQSSFAGQLYQYFQVVHNLRALDGAKKDLYSSLGLHLGPLSNGPGATDHLPHHSLSSAGSGESKGWEDALRLLFAHCTVNFEHISPYASSQQGNTAHDSLPAAKAVPFAIRRIPKQPAHTSKTRGDAVPPATRNYNRGQLLPLLAVAEKYPGTVSEWSVFCAFLNDALSQIQRLMDAIFPHNHTAGQTNSKLDLRQLTSLTTSTGYTSLMLQLMHITGLVLGIGLRIGAPMHLTLPTVFYEVFGNSTDLKLTEADVIVSAGTAVSDCVAMLEAAALCIRHGITAVFPLEVAALLLPADWKLLVEGRGGNCWSVGLLRAYAKYESGVTADDNHIHFFWAAMAELSNAQVEQFLRMVWSNCRISEDIICAPCTSPPAPIWLMPPTAMALLSPDSADIVIFPDRCAVSIPRYSSMHVMVYRLAQLLSSSGSL